MIKGYVLILLSALFSWNSILAQPAFQKNYSASYDADGLNMTMTVDGGYIMVGKIKPYADMYIIRTNSTGDTLWTRTIGETGTYLDEAANVCATSDSGFIICGHTYSFGNDAEMLLIKLNSGGNTEWSRIYGGVGADKALCVMQTADGGYIVGGSSTTNGNGVDDAAVLRLDTAGNILWSKRFGDNGPDRIQAILQLPDGGFLIAGNTAVNSFRIFLMRTDSVGDTLWVKHYASQSISAYSVEFTTDGGLIFAGSINFSNPSGILFKTDSLGTVQWSKYYGGNGFDAFYSGRQTSDGGYIALGATSSFGFGNNDMLLVRTDSIGDVQWSRVYGGTDDEFGRQVFQTNDGGYALFANQDYGFNSQYYLVKTDTFGYSNCNYAIVGASQTYLFLTNTSPNWVFSTGWTEATQPVLTIHQPTFVSNPCTGIGMAEHNEMDMMVTVSPNPFISETILKRAQPFSNATLNIANYMGQTVRRQTNVSGNEILIPRENIPSGFYIITLEEAGKEIARKKVVVVEN